VCDKLPYKGSIVIALRNMSTRRSTIVACVVICLCAIHSPVPAAANELFQFSDTSVSALTGWGYQLPGNRLSVITLENANSWIGGDFFGFVDIRYQHDHPFNRRSWYGEASPRFSLAKLAGMDFGNGILKDVLIATTWERGEDGNESFLIGGGVSLDLPDFRFFKANLYARKDKSLGAA
jgi:nucleoside-specific outer membrane channel protein Tsx